MTRMLLTICYIVCMSKLAMCGEYTTFPIARFSDVNKPHPQQVAYLYTRMLYRNASLSNRCERKALQARLQQSSHAHNIAPDRSCSTIRDWCTLI